MLPTSYLTNGRLRIPEVCRPVPTDFTTTWDFEASSHFSKSKIPILQTMPLSMARTSERLSKEEQHKNKQQSTIKTQGWPSQSKTSWRWGLQLERPYPFAMSATHQPSGVLGSPSEGLPFASMALQPRAANGSTALTRGTRRSSGMLWRQQWRTLTSPLFPLLEFEQGYIFIVSLFFHGQESTSTSTGSSIYSEGCACATRIRRIPTTCSSTSWMPLPEWSTPTTTASSMSGLAKPTLTTTNTLLLGGLRSVFPASSKI